MSIANESWFWTGIFVLAAALLGSLLTLVGTVARERLSRVTAIKIERIKLHEAARFEAYKMLFEFVSSAYALYWPPDAVEDDFRSVMKDLYYKHVKAGFPYFEPALRDLLRELESQYQALFDPKLEPRTPRNVFFDHGYLDTLNRINEVVESRFAEWTSAQ